jgi:hypothetical protein
MPHASVGHNLGDGIEGMPAGHRTPAGQSREMMNKPFDAMPVGPDDRWDGGLCRSEYAGRDVL